MTVRDMLKRGDFNHMSQSAQPDGSLLVTLTKRGDPHTYKLWVRNLYLPTERVLKEEVTPPVIASAAKQSVPGHGG